MLEGGERLIKQNMSLRPGYSVPGVLSKNLGRKAGHSQVARLSVLPEVAVYGARLHPHPSTPTQELNIFVPWTLQGTELGE